MYMVKRRVASHGVNVRAKNKKINKLYYVRIHNFNTENHIPFGRQRALRHVVDAKR